MTRLRADFLLLMTALVWGAAFVGQSTAMDHLGPFTFTGIRFCLATLAVLPFAIAEGKNGPALHRSHINPMLVVSALFWALQVILIGSIAKRSNRPVTLATIQFAVAAALSLIVAVVLETPSILDMFSAWRELLFTGLLSGGVGFTLQAIAQRHTPASDAAIIMSSEALFAALFGMALLGERLDTWGLLGCALIFSAVLIVQLVPFWRQRDT